jgi:hypothetical protein
LEGEVTTLEEGESGKRTADGAWMLDDAKEEGNRILLVSWDELVRLAAVA